MKKNKGEIDRKRWCNVNSTKSNGLKGTTIDKICVNDIFSKSLKTKLKLGGMDSDYFVFISIKKSGLNLIEWSIHLQCFLQAYFPLQMT
jgi:hypothetical protein